MVRRTLAEEVETTGRRRHGNDVADLMDSPDSGSVRLQKHEATALRLLRTEVIGLNACLYSVNVPEILLRCECGWGTQHVRHVLCVCPLYRGQREDLYSQAGSRDLTEILSTPRGAQTAGRWLIRWGILPHLRLAGQIQQEDTGEPGPIPSNASLTISHRKMVTMV